MTTDHPSPLSHEEYLDLIEKMNEETERHVAECVLTGSTRIGDALITVGRIEA